MSFDPTIRYYDEHAEQYANETLSIDMGGLYAPFLERVPSGGRVLDLGCGPGRDVRAFTRMGYDVTGVDGSAAMVEIARGINACPIHQMTFEDIPWRNEFHGIWACASLLHVPPKRISDTLSRLSIALEAQGVLYTSFKTGVGASNSSDRVFTNLTEPELNAIIRETDGLIVEKLWITQDARPHRKDEQWLNALLRACRASG